MFTVETWTTCRTNRNTLDVKNACTTRNSYSLNSWRHTSRHVNLRQNVASNLGQSLSIITFHHPFHYAIHVHILCTFVVPYVFCLHHSGLNFNQCASILQKRFRHRKIQCCKHYTAFVPQPMNRQTPKNRQTWWWWCGHCMQMTESNLSFPYVFDWSEVILVQLGNITFDQSTHRYGKLTSLHVCPNEIIVSNEITEKQPVFMRHCGYRQGTSLRNSLLPFHVILDGMKAIFVCA